jgi:hypothetical protein
MRTLKYQFRPLSVSLAVACLLLGGTASAVSPSLSGVWGSALYRVDLTIVNGAVSGTFTQVETPQAPPGKITGQMQPGGQSFTALWTFPAGPYEASFTTQLSLAGRGSMLSGYRWTEETDPTAFGLHRAINGQVPATVSEADGSGTVAPPGNGGGNGQNNPGGGGATSPTAKLEVTLCERVTDGTPQNVTDQFTSPKTVLAFVKYTNLPANSNVQWVWTLNGKTEAQLTKTLSGNGWHYHGLQSQTAIIPGTYEVTVSLNGQVVAKRSLTVRGATATPPPPPPANDSPGAAPGLEIIVCESAPGGVPQNQSTVFVKPKSIVCLVKHTDLPANSAVVWVWTRGGERIARHEKALSGTGWAWHGLSSATSMTPGAYTVKIVVNGQEVTTTKITVR